MLSDTVIEKYILAGKIASQTLRKVYDYVSPKKYIDLLSLAEFAEENIIKSGGKPAFPCNVGYNNLAAHYTPIRKEVIKFDEGLLKVDVGVHIDGYIADTAITIARGYEYQEIAELNKRVLEDVLHMIKPGKKLGELGGYIEKKVSEYGYQVIRNLSGHLVDRYNLHAGKNFPNVKEYFTKSIKAGEVYAIEPFITFNSGAGSVIAGKIITIYSLAKIKKIKDKKLDKIKKLILSRYGRLPFTYRWIKDEVQEDLINALYKLGILKGYPILIEAKGAPVSQFEHTVIIQDEEVIVTTK